MLLTANNHTYDTQTVGFFRTQQVIMENGMDHIGTRPTLATPNYLVKDIGGIRFGMICYTYNTRSSIVSLPKGKVAIINGLRDYIVVDTDDVLLVCPRSDEQSIKKYIDDVRFDKGEKYV